MRNSFKLRNLSIAALVGLASMGVAQAQDTTTVTTTLPSGTEHSLELQTTYGEGNTSVTTNYTVQEQEVPYTYKFNNLYGDTENGDTSVTTETTILGQPVTFTYKYDSSTVSSRQTSFDGSDINNNFVGILADDHIGGAIYNSKTTIGDISADFYGNYAIVLGGAIANAKYNNFGGSNAPSIIGNINGSFIYNRAALSIASLSR